MNKLVPVPTIIILTVLIFPFLGPVPCYGQDDKKSEAIETIADLQGAIEKVMEETGTPAIGLALMDGDSTVWLAGLGKADIENDIKADENTMFRIGSTSKMFVSLAILKLQEEGRVNLKDKVRELVPEIGFVNPWHETNPILVEHLLEHTTGWDDMHLKEYALSEPGITLKEGLDFHPDSRISRWVPGTRMAYCNSGPPVAAYIVEKITGQPFESYIQEHFFEPMGMENATYFVSDSYKRLGATLYIDGEPQKYWHISLRPSGSINASPKDMARMLDFFINRGRIDSVSLISESSLQRMETTHSTTGAAAGLEHGYGLTNYSTPHSSFVYRSHNGGVNGGLTDFSYLPGHGLGYVFMINSGNGSALYRISKLIRNFQTKHLQADSASRPQAAPKSVHDMTGYYVPINPRVQMFYFFERIVGVKRLFHRDSSLYIRPLLSSWPEKYFPAGEGKYTYSKTGKIHVVQVTDPLAGEVVHEGSLVLKPISALVAFGQLVLAAAWAIGSGFAIILGIIWSIRYRMGIIPGGANISVRLWPFIAALLFLAIFILVAIIPPGDFESIGTVGFIPVSLMILTICFALAAIWSVVNVIKNRHAEIDTFLYWRSTVLSVLHLLMACYLLFHGVIGIRTWA